MTLAERGTSEAPLAQIASELETYVSGASAAMGICVANVAIHVRSGDAAPQIAALAAELEADIGTRTVASCRSRKTTRWSSRRASTPRAAAFSDAD